VNIIIRPMRPEDVPAAKHVMLTVAAGIFDPDHPAVTFINRHTSPLADVDDFRTQYGPPNGLFLVVVDEDEIIGTGAIRRIDDVTAELRRMWLLPIYHGQGIGYRLAQGLFDFARAAGYQTVRLSTSALQTQAIRFYKRLGFYSIPRYRDTDDEVFMEIRLGPAEVVESTADHRPPTTGDSCRPTTGDSCRPTTGSGVSSCLRSPCGATR